MGFLERMVVVKQGFLSIQGGPTDGTSIPLAGKPIFLGRGPENEVVIDEPTVSWKHALITDSPFGFVLRDLGSFNGTYVNGMRMVQPQHVLREEDKIRLADAPAVLVFRDEASAGGDMAQDSPPAPVEERHVPPKTVPRASWRPRPRAGGNAG